MIIACIFLNSGCTVFYADSTVPSKSIPLNRIQKTKKNYLINGRLVFETPTGSTIGDMTIQIFKNSDFEMRIFTPLVGTLIYSLSANSEKLLISNFQEKYYLLTDNTLEIRRKWLGMDLSLSELKWLILGEVPKEKQNWINRKISKNKQIIYDGSKEIIFELNSEGQISSMEKLVDGFLEYRAFIPIYKKFSNTFFPRKISINDVDKKNQWKMLISEIIIQPKKIKPLKFKPPKNLEEYRLIQ